MLLSDQKRRYPKLAFKFYDQLKMSQVAHMNTIDLRESSIDFAREEILRVRRHPSIPCATSFLYFSSQRGSQSDIRKASRGCSEAARREKGCALEVAEHRLNPRADGP